MRFRNLSIRQKQTLVIMLTSSIALLLACAVFAVYDVASFRKQIVGQARSLADVIGKNCAAALDFDDPDSARETLAALHEEQAVVGAFLYRKEDSLFAKYQRNPGMPVQPLPAPGLRQEAVFDREHLILIRPILRDGQTIGNLTLVYDLNQISEKLGRYMEIAGMVFLASLLVTFVLSDRLQRLVTGPIQNLARATRLVSTEKDFSVRVQKESRDELGQLIDDFNEMLAQIQTRDAALKAAQENLEQRVEDRTRELKQVIEAHQRTEQELRESQALYYSLVEQLPAGVYRKNVAGRYVFANSWFCQLKGLSPEQMLGRTPAEIAADLPGPGGGWISNSDWESNLAKQDTAHHESILATRMHIEQEEEHPLAEGSSQFLHVVKSPVFGSGGELAGTQGILLDITARKKAEAELVGLHRQLLDVSRQAGMAEVATNVLHNVGNVLNSVNVSASIILSQSRNSKAPGIGRLVNLLEEQKGGLSGFFSQPGRSEQVKEYLRELYHQIELERTAVIRELEELTQNIEHIKEIVAMQQNYSKVAGVTEFMDVTKLVEDAIRMNAGALDRHGVQIARDFQTVPPIPVEKHKVLQILVNLLRNAKYACDDSHRSDKKIGVRVTREATFVRITVQDNGVGIPKENLTRIFSHGFTTRKNGHGFGLHSGAIAARDLGGALQVQSDGPGLGATFCLDLPAA